MTKDKDEMDFKQLDDLVIQLELKEAIENGDLGQMMFCIKHLTLMVQSLTKTGLKTQDQLKKITAEYKEFLNTINKALVIVNEQQTTQNEWIMKIIEKVKVLEEKNADN